MSERDGYEPGVPCWVDTWQADPAAAASFYAALFGWEAEETTPPDSPRRRFMCRVGGRDVAGVVGTRCTLRWRHDDRETVWTVAPGHPIAADVPECFVIPEQEMYGEFFDVPPPDELVFISSFTGGEVFRSGCCWTRGRGRIFYFSPGHETNPVYHQPEVQRVLVDAVRWVGPRA
jgi:hypothetical protein